jgi:biopolymer transport protein ExbD
VRRRYTDDNEAEINITPMLDIVFIMLIFFIVTASFVKEPGVAPSLPIADTAEAKARANVLIAISETGQIWMNKRPVSLEDVRGLVETARAENPESSAVIIADQRAASGVLIDLMDQIRLGGIGQISVAAQPGN